MIGQLDLLKWTPPTGEVVSLDRLFDRVVYRPERCACGENAASLRRCYWGESIRLAIVCCGCNKQGRMLTKREHQDLAREIRSIRPKRAAGAR
jgi:hypothetical protein